MSKELLVPDIGDFSGVAVIEILVKEGDTLSIDDPVITLESDKASMDVPATAGGVIKQIKVAVGDTVSAGSLMLILEDSGEASVNVGANDPHPVVAIGGVAAAAPSDGGGDYGGGGLEEILVPDIGDFDEVDVIEVLVAEGDTIAADDSLITLESDKASMDIPAPKAGDAASGSGDAEAHLEQQSPVMPPEGLGAEDGCARVGIGGLE